MNKIIIVIALLFLHCTAFAATTTYEYDELDRLHRVTLENGQKITYEYDEIGNLLSKTPSGGVVTITASAGDGGTIYPNSTTTVTVGNSKLYTITPLTGYQISNVVVDGISQGSVNTYTFTNLAVNHTIAAYFQRTIEITTTALQSGFTQTAYLQNVAATGGTAPYTWSITSGILPDGLIISATTGTISGTPTTAGSNFTVQVKDANNFTATKDFSISITTTNVKIVNKQAYSTIQAAYDAAVNGDIIQCQAQAFTENLIANRNIVVTLEGGYNAAYSTNSGTSRLKGAPRISNGTVYMKNFSVIY